MRPGRLPACSVSEIAVLDAAPMLAIPSTSGHHLLVEWLPDERVWSGVSGLSDDDVAAFERSHEFDPSREVARLQALGLSQHDLVVEFGSGPGGFAIAAAGIARELIAVDPSPAMCTYLSRRATEAGIDNIEVINAGFLTYQHQRPPARFVFSKNALHHLPDFWKAEALVRIRGLLEPAGVLRLRDLVFSFQPEEADERIDAWIDSTAAEGRLPRERLINHVRSEFSTYTWLLEEMLDRAGFDISDRCYSDSGIFAHYTCRRR